MTANTNRDLCTGYRELLSRFNDTDAERNETINRLISELERLQIKQQETCKNLEIFQSACHQLHDQKGELEASMNGRSFVLVLLDADGDDYIFQERFLNKNDIGGKDAADEIHARTKEYLKSIKIDPDNTEILVRAYANVKSLEEACVRNGKMLKDAKLDLFAQGFTRRHAHFDFVDVGAGKEEADNKIRECLSLYLGHWHCKHVILGACHDSGYASHLGRFASDNSTRDRITLLQGSTMSPRIKALGFSRPPLRFDSVFAATMGPVASNLLSSRVVPKFPTAGPVTAQVPPRPSGHSNPAALTGRLRLVRDAEGRRVDKPLDVDPNMPYMNVLRQANFCGYYYLRGLCDFSCGKSHFPLALNAHEFDCLWYLMRQGLCHKARRGKDCVDAKCIYGHQPQS